MLNPKWAAGLLALAAVLGVAKAATVSGTVTDEVTGDPIAGADVFVIRGLQLAGQTSTDSGGNYIVPGLPAGTYLVGAAPVGYGGEVFDNVPTADFENGTPIVLALDTVRDDIDFALQPLRRITGTVTRADNGAPLPDVHLTAASTDASFSAQAQSDATGAYVLFVPEGSFKVAALDTATHLGEYSNDVPCTRFDCDPTNAAVIPVAGADVGGVDFDLLAGAQLSGVITDAVTGGIPSRAIQVLIARDDGNVALDFIDSTFSADGTWLGTTAFPPGSYRFMAHANDEDGYFAQVHDGRNCSAATRLSCTSVVGEVVTVAAGGSASVNFVMAPTTGSVAGTVTAFAGGAPLGGVRVVLATQVNGGGLQETTSAPDGSFRIDGVAPGSYVVRAEPAPPLAQEYFPNQQCFQFACPPSTQPTPIDVSAGQTHSGVDFALAPLAAVSVTLRNSDTGASTGGELMIERNGILSTHVEVAGAGVATDIALPNGGTLRFAGWGRNTCGDGGDEWCLGRLYPNLPCPQLQCRFDAGEALTLGKGQRIENVVLDMDVGAVIAGTVTAAADGTPIGNQFLQAYSGNLPVAAALSDGDGHYEFVGLGGGPYAIRTQSESAWIDELYDNIPCPQSNCLLSDGTLISPTIGARVDNIDFALSAGAHITGSVRSSNNNLAVSGARITVYDAAGIEIATATTGFGGAFRTQAMPSGSYYLKVSAGSHVTELFDDVACAESTCDPLTATPIELVVPADRDDIEIVLAFDPNSGGGVGAGPTGPATIVYINRCEGGCVVTPGNNDSRTNRSSVARGTHTLSAFPHGDERFEELVACLRGVFAPFNITITDVDPGSVPHHENMVAGTPQQLGLGSGVGGVSPFSCGTIENSITFTFAQTLGDNLADLCDTSAMEIAHSFGLDHEVHCEDPMTYLTGCGAKRFINADVPCGEYGGRACVCGGTTQNSFQSLVAAVGVRQDVFADGFEDDDVTARMKAEYERGMNAGKRFQRDHCGTHED